MANITVRSLAQEGGNWWDSAPVVGQQLAPRDRELAVRTVLGEAADQPDEGMAGVAAVIRNRLQSGKFGDNLPRVVLSPNQFEPWGTQEGRSRMMAYTPESEPYQRASKAVDAIFGGQMDDPTQGATYFFSPTAQSALGRQPPSWAQGEPVTIGQHNFYGGKQDDSWWQSAPVVEGQQPQAAMQVQPTIADRSDIGPQPENADELRAGLEQNARQRTEGAPATPAQSMLTDLSNILPSATQGTSPNVDMYGGRLVSAETFENDDGSISYRDPQTGQVVPTDTARQVAIRDPADNTVKVFERSEATDEGPAVGMSRVLAPGLAAGAPVARPAIPVGAARSVTPRASDIMATAKPFYKAFKNEAGKIEVPADIAQGLIKRIEYALSQANLIPELASPIYSAVAAIGKGSVKTVADLQNIKRVIGRGFNSPDKNIRDAAAVASREIGKIIFDISKEASKNLRTADQIHSTALAKQALQRKEAVAGLRAGRAGYGGNAVNSMRQVLAPIVQRAIEGKTTGFRPDEIKAMQDIVEGTAATNFLRWAGQASPSKGIIQSAAGAAGMAGGAAAMGPAGAALFALIPVLGAAANKIATILTAKQIEKLGQLISKRSPAYAQAVKKSIDRYENAQIAFASNPSPNKFAAYMSASRALSAGLTRDGIAVTSGDLLRAIRGPVQGAAEDEQPPVPGVPGQ